MDIELSIIFWSLMGGVIPAVLWLLFWLRQDSKRPEPRGLILLTFIGGMVVVPLVIPFQKASFNESSLFITFMLWAFFEESAKYLAAYFTSLRKEAVNEPLDPIIYMLTAALGFAAVENSLFILSSLLDGNILGGIVTGNLRFIGASLLHTISSASIGVAMALSFYKSRRVKFYYLSVGLLVAIALHTIFNLFIIRESNTFALGAFGFVWVFIVILMMVFEKVKRIRPI